MLAYWVPTILQILIPFRNLFSPPVMPVVSNMVDLIVLVVLVWFFIEFGCMRGTIGVNRYGPDPV